MTDLEKSRKETIPFTGFEVAIVEGEGTLEIAGIGQMDSIGDGPTWQVEQTPEGSHWTRVIFD